MGVFNEAFFLRIALHGVFSVQNVVATTSLALCWLASLQSLHGKAKLQLKMSQPLFWNVKRGCMWFAR